MVTMQLDAKQYADSQARKFWQEVINGRAGDLIEYLLLAICFAGWMPLAVFYYCQFHTSRWLKKR